LRVPANVDAGTALIDRHPDTRFIIDHLAILQPRTPPVPAQPWADLPKVLDAANIAAGAAAYTGPARCTLQILCGPGSDALIRKA
jgi:hypothetical protein